MPLRCSAAEAARRCCGPSREGHSRWGEASPATSWPLRLPSACTTVTSTASDFGALPRPSRKQLRCLKASGRVEPSLPSWQPRDCARCTTSLLQRQSCPVEPGVTCWMRGGNGRAQATERHRQAEQVWGRLAWKTRMVWGRRLELEQVLEAACLSRPPPLRLPPPLARTSTRPSAPRRSRCPKRKSRSCR